MAYKGQSKEDAITLVITLLFVFGIIFGGYMLLFYEKDHGEVTNIKAWWRMPAIYDGHVIESGDDYVLCRATYEDGEEEYVHEWEIDKPVTLSNDKKVSFKVSYGGKTCNVVVDPKKYEPKQPDSVNVNLSREAQHYSLAEELIVNYPRRERQFYLDMLVEEGLTYEEAEAALQCAGY